MTETTLVERWESKSGKWWVELTHDQFGYAYSSPGSGGSFGNLADGRERFHKMLEQGLFQPDANRTPMHRVR